jgi:hypothetical protein
MLQSCLGIHTLFRVGVHHFLDHILRIEGNAVPIGLCEFYLRRLVCSHQLRIGLAVKGLVATQHDIKCHTCREDIDLVTVATMHASGKYLGWWSGFGCLSGQSVLFINNINNINNNINNINNYVNNINNNINNIELEQRGSHLD